MRPAEVDNFDRGVGHESWYKEWGARDGVARVGRNMGVCFAQSGYDFALALVTDSFGVDFDCLQDSAMVRNEVPDATVLNREPEVKVTKAQKHGCVMEKHQMFK